VKWLLCHQHRGSGRTCAWVILLQGCTLCRYRAAAAPQPAPDPAARPARAPRQLSETERAARMLFPDEFSSEDEADEATGEGAANGNLPAPQQTR